jgi:hypothetical protein
VDRWAGKTVPTIMLISREAKPPVLPPSRGYRSMGYSSRETRRCRCSRHSWHDLTSASSRHRLP